MVATGYLHFIERLFIDISRIEAAISARAGCRQIVAQITARRTYQYFDHPLIEVPTVFRCFDH